MALKPVDESHALQIQAGTLGRKAGHEFEDTIASKINNFRYPFNVQAIEDTHLFPGDPSYNLLVYIGNREKAGKILKATAISTGALATSEEGKNWLSINGVDVNRCKSDLVITLSTDLIESRTIGVSTKQCNNKSPTNAQLFLPQHGHFQTFYVQKILLYLMPL